MGRDGRQAGSVSRLTVGRLLHICEVLSISPKEILFPVAPHLWGEDQVEAEARMAITEKLAKFDGPTLRAILSFLHHLKTKQNDEGGNGYDGAAPAAPLRALRSALASLGAEAARLKRERRRNTGGKMATSTKARDVMILWTGARF